MEEQGHTVSSHSAAHLGILFVSVLIYSYYLVIHISNTLAVGRTKAACMWMFGSYGSPGVGLYMFV